MDAAVYDYYRYLDYDYYGYGVFVGREGTAHTATRARAELAQKELGGQSWHMTGRVTHVWRAQFTLK